MTEESWRHRIWKIIRTPFVVQHVNGRCSVDVTYLKNWVEEANPSFVLQVGDRKKQKLRELRKTVCHTQIRTEATKWTSVCRIYGRKLRKSVIAVYIFHQI